MFYTQDAALYSIEAAAASHQPSCASLAFNGPKWPPCAQNDMNYIHIYFYKYTRARISHFYMCDRRHAFKTKTNHKNRLRAQRVMMRGESAGRDGDVLKWTRQAEQCVVACNFGVRGAEEEARDNVRRPIKMI